MADTDKLRPMQKLEARMSAAQMQMILRLLIGALHETRLLIKEGFDGTRLSSACHPEKCGMG